MTAETVVTPEEVMTADGAPEEPTVIPREVRLELANAQLRHMNAVKTLQLHQVRGELLVDAENLAGAHYHKLLSHLSLKYKFDPRTQEMDAETGVIRPRLPQAGPGPVQ